MTGLREYPWKIAYGPADDRVQDFYIPALSRSVSYDRTAGYFSSLSLAHAATGVAHLIRNGGRMRLLAGAQLLEEDVEAVRRGEDLRARIEAGLLRELRDPANLLERERLEALAWMVARGMLEIRVVVPLDAAGKPLPSSPEAPYFHVKNGVFTDAAGDQVGFTGSVNESLRAWDLNYEDLAIYLSWTTPEGDTRAHLKGVVARFSRLWQEEEPAWRAFGLPEAVRRQLLRFEPPREPGTSPVAVPDDQDERVLFGFVRDAPRLVGARALAAATSTIRPWPHQVRVADTVVSRYPEGFLLCDEVGLGKTIEAGLILRQLLLDGRVKRALLLVPRSVLNQFQDELYEKFVLDVPEFDGAVFRYRDGREERPLTANPWDGKDVYLASSQLAKRRDRRDDVIRAGPFDLVLVDEAHHARRRGGFQDLEHVEPNNLLTLLRALRERGRARCLVLMTATPLQMHPVEVFDLLQVLGLGGRWGAHHSNFISFFEELRKDSPDWRFVLGMVDDARAMGVELDSAFARAAEQALGPVDWQRVRQLPGSRDGAGAVARMAPPAQAWAREMARRLTPLRTRLQRNTRDLLRRYRQKGLLNENVPDRDVQPVWISFSPEEAQLYEEVETYISHFYKKFEAQRRGLGFVMTVYRRRLTSSFFALQESLKRRLRLLRGEAADAGLQDDDIEQEDLSRDVAEEDTRDALNRDEIEYVEGFLSRLVALPAESKLVRLHEQIHEVFRQRETVVIFTQYADTMDYVREGLRDLYGQKVACYSGRGGERWDGTRWAEVRKEEVKDLFRKGQEVQILIGTDAMSEGLNLQTCGVLINFDMPWNPMRVEQRIGRIDRIGQKHGKVWVRNYFYEKSVEALVYERLRDRIRWFEHVVGKLQPILTQVGKTIQELSMGEPQLREADLDRAMRDVDDAISRNEAEGLDLDAFVEEEPPLPDTRPPPVAAAELERLLVGSRRLKSRFRKHPSLTGVWLLRHGGGDVAVTFDRDVFDGHPDTVRYLTHGEPLLEELLAEAPSPDEAPEGAGRVVRCSADAPALVGYYSGSGEIGTLSALDTVLRAKAPASRETSSAVGAFRGAAALLAAREGDVLRATLAGEALARKEEARMALRRATALHIALAERRSGTLSQIEERRQLGFVVDEDSAVREFARTSGPPYAPLFRLLGNDEVALRPEDPFLAEYRGKKESSLIAIEPYLRTRAQDLVLRLKWALDALGRLDAGAQSVAVQASGLR